MTDPDLLEALDRFERDADASVGAKFVDLAARYFRSTRPGNEPVSTALDAAELGLRFAEPPPAEGRSLDEILGRLEHDVLGQGNRLMHPMYLGHQVSAPLPSAVWTEVITAALNNSGAVWEMSPSGTTVEMQVIRWMCDAAGFGQAAGGTFTSGGTEATFTALLAARAAAMPDSWELGITGPPPVVLCGEHTHYAAMRAAAELGIGMQNVIAIPSRHGKLDPIMLVRRMDALRAERRKIMAVIATSGCTATGAFDDLEAIGAACEARDVWLHVDAAHGGSALLSTRHRHRMNGAQLARTVAWDPHKMMLLPLSAGALLARDEADLSAAFAQQAPYLFLDRDGGRSLDQGTRSFMCSRRVDAIKVWVALQRYGVRGIGALHDHLCAMAMELHALLGERPDFEVLHVPESNILCFRWIGDRQLDDPSLGPFNRALRDRYNRSGRGWITGTTLGGRRVLRVTVMNPRTRASHLAELVAGLAEEAALMRDDGNW